MKLLVILNLYWIFSALKGLSHAQWQGNANAFGQMLGAQGGLGALGLMGGGLGGLGAGGMGMGMGGGGGFGAMGNPLAGVNPFAMMGGANGGGIGLGLGNPLMAALAQGAAAGGMAAAAQMGGGGFGPGAAGLGAMGMGGGGGMGGGMDALQQLSALRFASPPMTGAGANPMAMMGNGGGQFGADMGGAAQFMNPAAMQGGGGFGGAGGMMGGMGGLGGMGAGMGQMGGMGGDQMGGMGQMGNGMGQMGGVGMGQMGPQGMGAGQAGLGLGMGAAGMGAGAGLGNGLAGAMGAGMGGMGNGMGGGMGNGMGAAFANGFQQGMGNNMGAQFFRNKRWSKEEDIPGTNDTKIPFSSVLDALKLASKVGSEDDDIDGQEATSCGGCIPLDLRKITGSWTQIYGNPDALRVTYTALAALQPASDQPDERSESSNGSSSSNASPSSSANNKNDTSVQPGCIGFHFERPFPRRVSDAILGEAPVNIHFKDDVSYRPYQASGTIQQSLIPNQSEIRFKISKVDVPMCLIKGGGPNTTNANYEYVVFMETRGVHRCKALHVLARSSDTFFRSYSSQVIEYLQGKVRAGESHTIKIMPNPEQCEPRQQQQQGQGGQGGQQEGGGERAI